MDSQERREVRRALDALKPFLAAYLLQRGVQIEQTLSGSQPGRRGHDVHALLKACLANWDATLRRELPTVARSYIHELIDIRNRWAHEEPFSRLEAARATDTARQFAALLGAPSVSFEAPRSPSSPVLGRKETQRDVMIRLFVTNRHIPEVTIQAYAAAERNGEVRRKSNKRGKSAEDYARALFADGAKKGWLTATTEARD